MGIGHWPLHLQVEKRRYKARNLSDDLIDAFSTNVHRFESLVIRGALPERYGPILNRSSHASLATTEAITGLT